MAFCADQSDLDGAPRQVLPFPPAGQGKSRWQARSFALPFRPSLFMGDITMGQQANTGKSTKQQPAGKGQPQPKKGK